MIKPPFVFHVVPWSFWKLLAHFPEIISLLIAFHGIQLNCVTFKIKKLPINLRVQKAVTEKLFYSFTVLLVTAYESSEVTFLWYAHVPVTNGKRFAST